MTKVKCPKCKKYINSTDTKHVNAHRTQAIRQKRMQSIERAAQATHMDVDQHRISEETG